MELELRQKLEHLKQQANQIIEDIDLNQLILKLVNSKNGKSDENGNNWYSFTQQYLNIILGYNPRLNSYSVRLRNVKNQDKFLVYRWHQGKIFTLKTRWWLQEIIKEESRILIGFRDEFEDKLIELEKEIINFTPLVGELVLAEYMVSL